MLLSAGKFMYGQMRWIRIGSSERLENHGRRPSGHGKRERFVAGHPSKLGGLITVWHCYSADDTALVCDKHVGAFITTRPGVAEPGSTVHVTPAQCQLMPVNVTYCTRYCR